MVQATAGLKLIDPYDANDLAFTFHLRNTNREFFFTDRPLEWSEHVHRHQSNFGNHFSEFFIIWCDGQRAGTLGVRHKPEYEHLESLCVSTEFRGRGLAKFAIRSLMKPNRFIVAQVKTDNKHVIKMYQDLGFWKVR